jgi:hypothetical protein
MYLRGLRSAPSRASESVLGRIALVYTTQSLAANRGFRYLAESVGSRGALLPMSRFNRPSGLPKRALPVSVRWPDSTVRVCISVQLVLISPVALFSPFLLLFSRATKSECGLPARTRAAFCRETKNLLDLIHHLAANGSEVNRNRSPSPILDFERSFGRRYRSRLERDR